MTAATLTPGLRLNDLNLTTPAIDAAVAVYELATVRYDRAEDAVDTAEAVAEVYRTGTGSRRARQMVRLADSIADAAQAETRRATSRIERAIRAANPAAPERLITAARQSALLAVACR